jgi:hypothetical protein
MRVREHIPMKKLTVTTLLAAFVLVAQLLGAVASRAQDDHQDPPSRVARLNFSSGSVSFQPGGEGDWLTAVQNRPLTSGDNLWADRDSRAELHVGSTAIRIDSETSLSFLDLDDRTLQLRLALGAVELRVRHIDDGDLVEVDTPNLAFTIEQPGEYRIDVNSDGTQTTTTIWRGHAEATGGGYSYTVVAGQRATFTGTDQLDHEISQIPRRDDFDQWCADRNSREDGDESSNYISREMTGYEDLDDYGRWHYVAEYGPVWTPTAVAAGWAPYRFGHWVWIEPWGWTWVEDEPWGFAPFHYGRWAFVDSAWCWVPGPVVVRPVYAPALVAFIGGGGFNLAIGMGGGVAWFPLGPREVYIPPYRVSRVYVNNVNITNTRVNVTQVTNVYNTYVTNNNVNRIVYVNQHVPNGVTAVSRETFITARTVSRNLAQVNSRELESAPVTHQINVQPARTSVLGAGAPARFRPPAAVERRPVVATRNPAPPRVPFEQREAQAPNVRTEPVHPAGPTAPARPVQPANPPRPGEPAPTNAPANIPRPAEPVRPSEPAYPGRPSEPPRPAEPPRGNQPENVVPPATPRPPQGQLLERPQHPLVRPAPPVERRPQVEQNEANKFHNWQQNRPPATRQNAPRPPERSAPRQEERNPRR